MSLRESGIGINKKFYDRPALKVDYATKDTILNLKVHVG